MLLGIDTSGAVSVAVAGGDLTGPAPEILQVRSDERSRHHDEVLLALIDETLRAAGVEGIEDGVPMALVKMLDVRAGEIEDDAALPFRPGLRQHVRHGDGLG